VGFASTAIEILQGQSCSLDSIITFLTPQGMGYISAYTCNFDTKIFRYATGKSGKPIHINVSIPVVCKYSFVNP
jgi:hypothetical protein